MSVFHQKQPTVHRLGFGTNWANSQEIDIKFFFVNGQITLLMCLVDNPNIIGLLTISLDLSQFVVLSLKMVFPIF